MDGLLVKLPWWNFVDWTPDFKGGVPPQDDNGGSASPPLQFAEALDTALISKADSDASALDLPSSTLAVSESVIDTAAES